MAGNVWWIWGSRSAPSRRVLLLDEPLAGLAAAERERVSEPDQERAANIPVLIVEHDIRSRARFFATVTVMNQGQVLMTGTPDAVRADRRVQEIYTGTGIPRSSTAAPTRPGKMPRRSCA